MLNFRQQLLLHKGTLIAKIIQTLKNVPGQKLTSLMSSHTETAISEADTPEELHKFSLIKNYSFSVYSAMTTSLSWPLQTAVGCFFFFFCMY